jgi:hypothetical protein
MFQKSRCLKGDVDKTHTEDPRILVATVNNLVNRRPCSQCLCTSALELDLVFIELLGSFSTSLNGYVARI